MSICFSYFYKDFIHLFKREHKQRGVAEGEGEADSLLSREPDMGLDLGLNPHPGTLGS